MINQFSVDVESNPGYGASALQWAAIGYERAEKKLTKQSNGIHPFNALVIFSVVCSDDAISQIDHNARKLANYVHVAADWTDDATRLTSAWYHTFWQSVGLGVALGVIAIREGHIFPLKPEIRAETTYQSDVRSRCQAIGRLFGNEINDSQRWIALGV